MEKIYSVIINLFIFFFLIVIFTPALSILGDDTLVNKLAVGLIFGFLMAVVPNILKFFKLPVNAASQFLVTFMLSFIFFFLSLYALGIISISSATIDFGVNFIPNFELSDRTMALVVLSIFSSILSVGVEELSRRR